MIYHFWHSQLLSQEDQPDSYHNFPKTARPASLLIIVSFSWQHNTFRIPLFSRGPDSRRITQSSHKTIVTLRHPNGGSSGIFKHETPHEPQHASIGVSCWTFVPGWENISTRRTYGENSRRRIHERGSHCTWMRTCRRRLKRMLTDV